MSSLGFLLIESLRMVRLYARFLSLGTIMWCTGLVVLEQSSNGVSL